MSVISPFLPSLEFTEGEIRTAIGTISEEIRLFKRLALTCPEPVDRRHYEGRAQKLTRRLEELKSLLTPSKDALQAYSPTTQG